MLLLIYSTHHYLLLATARSCQQRIRPYLYRNRAYPAVRLRTRQGNRCHPRRRDILALVSVHPVDVVAIASVEHVIALVVTGLIHGAACQEVVTWPTVHDVAAEPSPEIICSTKTMYLVLAGQLVSFVGAFKQAAVGAAGHVVCDIWSAPPIECPCLPASAFFGRCFG